MIQIHLNLFLEGKVFPRAVEFSEQLGFALFLQDGVQRFPSRHKLASKQLLVLIQHLGGHTRYLRLVFLYCLINSCIFIINHDLLAIWMTLMKNWSYFTPKILIKIIFTSVWASHWFIHSTDSFKSTGTGTESNDSLKHAGSFRKKTGVFDMKRRYTDWSVYDIKERADGSVAVPWWHTLIGLCHVRSNTPKNNCLNERVIESLNRFVQIPIRWFILTYSEQQHDCKCFIV